MISLRHLDFRPEADIDPSHEQLMMTMDFQFSYVDNWLIAPGAFWVHVPVVGKPGTFEPPAPTEVLHKGYALLQVEFQSATLVFSSAAQIEHYIDILARKLLPTTRQLSVQRTNNAGPNGHWLSKLPSNLKTPRARSELVRTLRAARNFATSSAPSGWFSR